MYNEFGIKHYKGKWPCTAKTLYSEKTLIGRLQQYFLIYFETFSVPTADTLFLLILSILALESAHSIRFLYQHFLSGITEKSLNVFYYACSYAKVDYSRFMNTTVRIALKLITDSLQMQPVFCAWMIRWYLNLAQNLKMFQNCLTMPHTTVPTIWMDTALWVSCSAYLSGMGIKYFIFPFLLVIVCGRKKSLNWNW